MTQNPKTSLKKTNIPWIWEIPEDWEVKKLKFVFKYVTWWTPSSGKSDYYDSENGYNWMTIADLDWKYTGESKNKITELAVKETNMRIVPKWSLLYSFKLSVGQLAFVSEDTYTNEAILSILPKEWLNLDFWYYALQAYFISNANENIYWAKIFNQFTIDNGLVIVPSYSDQIAIANFLDQKTAEIKKFVENKKKLINLLKEQKQSIIHRAVTKGIDPNAKMKESGIPWIWEIPEDWEVKKLKFVFKYATWWTPSSGKSDYYDAENGYNWITISDLNWKYTGDSKNKITELAIKEANMEIVPRWSLLYSFKLSVGQVAFVSEDTYTNEAILSIFPKEWLNLDFWYYALPAYFISSANENIYWAKIFNQFTIDNWFVICPPWEMQNIIVEFINKETSQIDSAIAKIEQEIALIEEYQTSLIYQAVTGKISIS